MARGVYGQQGMFMPDCINPGDGIVHIRLGIKFCIIQTVAGGGLRGGEVIGSGVNSCQEWLYWKLLK